jgi:hypothetical protein
VSTSEIVSVVAAVIAGAAFLNSVLQGTRANRSSDRANEIATESLRLSKEALAAEKTAFVEPLRYEHTRSRIVFLVSAKLPVREVEFEFMAYTGVGGKVRRIMVSAGELPFQHLEFAGEQGTLQIPPHHDLVATARWRQTETDAWASCGRYWASRDMPVFRPEDPEIAG